MKVLQINSVCGIGSTGRIATDIHQILLDQGHESYIAYGRGLPMNCDSAIRIGTKYDNYAHVALTRIYDKHGFGSKKATKEFIKKVEELNPDVIHLHNIHGYYINIELLFDYLKKADKPVIWTLHDCWAFTGHCAYFDFVHCNKWNVECDKCPQKKTYPASLIFDNSKNNYVMKKEIFTGIKNMTIVTPSKWLKKIVKYSFLGGYNIKVINNGIDLQAFRHTESDFRDRYELENKFVILGVASVWDSRKGFDYFIELSKRLEDDEVIVLVGLSEKQIKKLPENIIGIARTNSVKELVEIYSASSVFVNSTLEDNFPTTNLESIACGTPIISFATGGSVESVDNSYGYIVKKGDIEELLEKLRLVKAIGKTSYSNNAVLNARTLYRNTDRFQDYLDIYNSAVHK